MVEHRYSDLFLTAREALRPTQGENAANCARELLAAAAGKTTAEIIASRDIYAPADVAEALSGMLARMQRDEPLAYVLGEWDFAGMTLEVTPEVLIPRDDTMAVTELALACDLRVAGEKAVFGVPESDLGVAPCYGGTQRLARLCGPSVAKDLLFTARKVRADGAYRIGLADRLVPQESLMEETENLMKSIIKNGPVAIAACKSLVDQGLDMSFAAGLRYEAELNGMLADTEDAKEGLKSFFEKRPPVFQGK